jgi:hypothetical protein
LNSRLTPPLQILANRSLLFLSSDPPNHHQNSGVALASLPFLPNYPAALLDAAAAITLNPLYAKAWYRLGSGTMSRSAF